MAPVRPFVTSVFDSHTHTATHIVADKVTNKCAIIDSVLDFDANSGRSAAKSANSVIDIVKLNNFEVEWIFETHIHADHLSAASYLKEKLGGKIVIGSQITAVQATLGQFFNVDYGKTSVNSPFDLMLSDGEILTMGELDISALHTPGHTPACMTYRIGDCVFVGDTLFMPDYGTARCDFPGGDAHILYESIQKILSLCPKTRMFLCHDYLGGRRTCYSWETTVEDQRRDNIHVHDGISENQFVEMRNRRDENLSLPELFIPSVQVNMNGGDFPAPEENGIHYLKIPLNVF